MRGGPLGRRAGREPSALRRAEPHGGARPRRARRRCAHGDARQEKPRGRDRRAEYRGAFPAVPGDDGVVHARVRAPRAAAGKPARGDRGKVLAAAPPGGISRAAFAPGADRGVSS